MAMTAKESSPPGSPIRPASLSPGAGKVIAFEPDEREITRSQTAPLGRSALVGKTTKLGQSVLILSKKNWDDIDISQLTVTELEELRPDRARRRKERDLLLRLMESLGGRGWFCRDGWAVDGRDEMVMRVGTWYGVVTDELEAYRVVVLNLNRNNLKGQGLHPARCACDGHLDRLYYRDHTTVHRRAGEAA
jgi:hypothetical protein